MREKWRRNECFMNEKKMFIYVFIAMTIYFKVAYIKSKLDIII